MKYFSQIKQEQQNEIQILRNIARPIITEKIMPDKKIKGCLLTGSVARGDARTGQFGLMIDLALVVENRDDIDLENMFGKDEEPFIPYHCVRINEKIGIAIELMEENDLWKIREKPEPVIFAKNESIILDDKTGMLKKWKDEFFIITDEQARLRALNYYFRFDYLTGEYRFEKWGHREAWTQIAQNFNEAGECYCNFLYCINKMFIPRKDWLAYLTYEMQNKPQKHDFYMDTLYTSQLDKESILKKDRVIQEIKKWIEQYCRNKDWL